MSTHDLGDSRRPTFKGFLKTRSWRQDPLPDVNQSGAARTTSITSIADIIPMIKSDSIMSLKDGDILLSDTFEWTI